MTEDWNNDSFSSRRYPPNEPHKTYCRILRFRQYEQLRNKNKALWLILGPYQYCYKNAYFWQLQSHKRKTALRKTLRALRQTFPLRSITHQTP